MGILLVDDSLDIQGLVKATLQQVGLTVVSADDGLSGLDIAISEKPDLILADFSVKGIDIFTFVKKIQKRSALAKTPIILLMSQGEHPDFATLQSAGLHTILRKPLDPHLLSEAVKKQLGISDQDSNASLAIEAGFLSDTEELPPFVEKTESEAETIPFDLFGPDNPTLATASIEKKPQEEKRPSHFAQTEKSTLSLADPEKVDEMIRKAVMEIVERVAWEVVPGIVEASVAKLQVHSLIEQVVWEAVPPLAEIEIKKEIKRLQPDEGFSA
ncbi:MAG: response regulator [Nitrospirota bacterium]